MADDLTTQKFGRLTVLKRSGSRGPRRQWLCACDCGVECLAITRSLRNGEKRSCGCLSSEVHSAAARRTMTTHGASKTRLFGRWQTMISRCHNPSVASYQNYGGRGISVCQSWRESFERFRSDVGDPENSSLTLERINNDGNYEPSNVRWATRKEQGANTRQNRMIEVDGVSRHLQGWSDHTGIARETIAYRLDAGWGIREILASGGDHF